MYPQAHFYDGYSTGQAGIQKGSRGTFNQVYGARNTDRGATWTTSLIYTAPLFTALNNFFPAIAVDPADGNVYAARYDAHNVSIASTEDHGQTWPAATVVNMGVVVAAVFPALAARSGTVDLSYYGTTPTSEDDSSAL